MQAKEKLRKRGRRKMQKLKNEEKKEGLNSKLQILNSSYGITLVALVVTIVVLLILAGITIMYVMGDNGVFSKAKNAKEQTESATFEERLNLAMQDAVMERALNGGLTPEEYFAILKKHGIISDVTVGGGNISSPTENTDGSKTYEITSDDDYIFEATIYPDGKIETEVIGKDGNIEAKIRSILVTNKTKTSIDIQVSARLQGGTVKAYYKKVSEVTAGEAEDNIAGYEEIALDSTNLTGKAQSLEAGQEYKIKAILEKDGKVVSSKSINVKTGVAVSSITLNKPEATIGVGKNLTLEAQVLPDEAEEKGITWSTSDSSIVTVDQNGKITGVKEGGPVTITATSKDVTTVKATCSVTVEEVESDWAKIAEMAAKIAKGEATDTTGTIVVNGTNKNVSSKKVMIGSKEETITVGDEFKVRYTESETSSILLKVRVLGFNHDTLAQATSYGAVGSKAGISFEFIEFVGDAHRMHSSNDKSVGWKGSEMRTYLNEGISSTTPALITKLSNAGYIKSVTKPYLLGTSAEVASTDCSDKLWLLSCSEIWANGRGSGANYGYAKAKEGDQYEYYQAVSPNGSTNDPNTYLKKKIHNGSTNHWWLRSPFYGIGDGFCSVGTNRLQQR